MRLSGWARYPSHLSETRELCSISSLGYFHRNLRGLIARGNGRSYGDAAIGQCVTVLTRPYNKIIDFEPVNGNLTVEAGALLHDLLRELVPRGFFPPVVPGTKFVTVGGMIAADVHGKNYHKCGGFGAQVLAFDLMLPSGEIVTCSPLKNEDLFAASIGGMGLTGTITQSTFRLSRLETEWLRSRVVVADDLHSTLAILQESAGTTYSVAWVDGLARAGGIGRSVVQFAEHVSAKELDAMDRPKKPFRQSNPRTYRLGFDLPSWVVNRYSLSILNALYKWHARVNAGNQALTHWNSYLFPLDTITDSNVLYGRRGFVQHQSVISTSAAYAAIGSILERVCSGGYTPFLVTLKQLSASRGLLSFPMKGYTLALDFPADNKHFHLLQDLDRIVKEADGRIYLAKDARQSRETFEAGYPELNRFREIRRMIGAEKMSSQLSVRLGI